MDELELPDSFDYSTLDEQTREIVLRKTNETHGLMKRTAESIIAIGQNLQIVQQHLPEMKFSAWLRAEFGLSRQSAYNFMRVASRFAGSCPTVLQLPARVLYELASSSDAIVEQVEAGQLPPAVAAIRAAKEAERQALEAEQLARAEVQARQATIAQLTRELEGLRQQLTELSARERTTGEGETSALSPEVAAHLEALQRQVAALTQQRDTLSRQVSELQALASTRESARGVGEHEQRVRLNWYRITGEFQRSLRTLLSQWPSPLDVLAFEADDWTRLSHLKELARRLLEECRRLTQVADGGIVDGAAVAAEDAAAEEKIRA